MDSFYRIIHPKTIHLQKLRIPEQFLANYRKDSSSFNWVSLKIPNGDEWKVKLVKENGDVWFQDGWKEFADHYSVSLYHFLIFTYSGNSIFEVVIFDKSASEIEYPSPKPLQKNKRKCEFDQKLVNPPNRDEPSEAEKQRALELAYAFESENPFFFIAVTPYFKKCNSNVPAKFRKEHFKNLKDRVDFTLWVSGKTWVVVYDANFYKLSKGWVAFAVDNHLVPGDVCVFELIKDIKNFLNVTIIRAKEKRKERSASFGKRSTRSMSTKSSSSSSEFQGSGEEQKEEEEDLEEVNTLESNSKYPSFKVVITPLFMGKGYPSIPSSFLKKYVKKDANVINLQVSDTTWEVKLSKGKQCRLTVGWKEFRNQNFICQGDVCVFQLIDRQNLVFKVTICKKTH